MATHLRAALLLVAVLAGCGGLGSCRRQSPAPAPATRTASSAPEGVSKPMVYPIPQQLEAVDQKLPLEQLAIVLPPQPSPQEQAAAQLLQRWLGDEFLVNLPVVTQLPPGKKPIFLGLAGNLPKLPPGLALKELSKAEGYQIACGSEGVLAAGVDNQGLLYAVSTLVQLAQAQDGQAFLRGARIIDWPYMKYRYVHLYVPSKDNIPFFKRYVQDFLLRYKYNGIILEIGGGVRLDKHPEIATGWRRTFLELYAHGDQIYKTGESGPLGPENRFQDTTHHGIAAGGYIEKEELADLVAFARAHGQEVVPEIQGLTHVYHLACARRDIAELPDALFPDAYCPSNPDSYKLLFETMDELLEVIKPPIVHIGHDEWRAGGLCPLCSQKPTAELFANDVIAIYRHLKEKGIGVWMWGDHFVSGHNEPGRSNSRGGPIWRDYIGTPGAWQAVRKECPDLVLLSWSWGLARKGQSPDKYDQELYDKGFRFLYGNFSGRSFPDWQRRSSQFEVLGAEVSSWCAMREFEIGKTHIPSALYSINNLWSTHWPEKDQATRQVMAMLPEVRQRLRGLACPPIRLKEPAQRGLDMSAQFNSPLKGPEYDLSGLRQGEFTSGDLLCRLGRGLVMVRRPQSPPGPLPLEVAIPVNANFQELAFLQSCLGKGRPNVSAGDSTFFPHDSSELIGLYHVVYRDGMIAPVEVRYDQNVTRWDAGLGGLFYEPDCIVAGRLGGGGELVIWANRWVNPRPDEPIAEIRFRGAGGPSQALPMLLGITGIQKPQLSDYRGAAAAK